MSGGDDRLLIISRPDELIAVVGYGIQIEKEQELPDLTMPRTKLHHFLDVVDKAIVSVLRERYSVQFDHIDKYLPDMVGSIYVNAATDSIADEYLEITAGILRAGGIRAVLGNNRDLAEALAFIGAMSRGAPFRAAVERELEGVGLRSQLIDDLVERGKRGLPLLLDSPPWLIAVV